MKFLWYMRGYLMDAAGGDGAGAGGGSGSGDGAGADKSGGQVDLTALKTELLTDIRKDLNGIAKSLKTDLTKLLTQQSGSGSGSGDGSGSGTGSGDGDGKGDGKGKPDSNAEVRELRNQLKTLQTNFETQSNELKGEREQRRNAERDRQAQAVLAGFQFADEEAARDAFDLTASKLKWTEDGQLVGPDGETPAGDWIKSVMARKTHLLAPRNTGGAGARGASGNGGGGSKPFNLEDIKPGMKPEDLARASQEIARAYAESQAGH